MTPRSYELVRLLWASADYRDPCPGRGHITGLDHALRVATLAHDEEEQFVGLVHDLARPLSDPFHGEVIAEIVRDRVSEIAYQVLRTHGQYQAALVHGTPVDDTVPWHTAALRLCRREEASFDVRWSRPVLPMFDALNLIRRWLAD